MLCWLGCERASERVACRFECEETEVSAFSYKACLLGLGLWYIQVRFGGGEGVKGKKTE